MKYVCLNPACGKAFMYAAKLTVCKSSAFSDVFQGVYPEQFETHHCPYCQGLDFTEYTEPQAEITSIKSVDISEADEWIAKGYRVLDRYAKTVTVALMNKKEVSEK